MKIAILDEGLGWGKQLYQLLTPQEMPAAMASSFQDLQVLLTLHGHPELLVANLSGAITAASLTEIIGRLAYTGPLLVLAKALDDPGLAALRRRRNTVCASHSGDPKAAADLVRGTLAGAPAPPSATVAKQRAATQMFHGIVGQSKAMTDVFARCEKVAAAEANVCIVGESGTGKELIARAIHYASARRDRPLITLDCTTIPEGLMESQLFGHVRGAFTGAIATGEGVFSLAHTGTLFIDELCELSLPLQAKLLRVVQTREVFKVGGNKPTRTDIRLIAATNRELRAEVNNGRFREDLYHRVAVVMIRVPALRERREDIPLLVEHFLERFARVYERPIHGVTAGAMQSIMEMPWPGNVRQLENFLEQGVVLAEGDVLTEQDLFSEEAVPVNAPAIEPGMPLREVERRHILSTLKKAKGNRTEAARMLGISVRGLQYKLKSYAQDPSLARQLESRLMTG